MRIPLSRLAICATFVASTLIARADSYTFLISTGSTGTTPGTTFVVNGTLTGTPDPTIPDALDLTGITGSGQGYTFTGIVPLGAVPTITYDNLLYTDPNVIHVDTKGILVDLTSSAGTSLAHIYDAKGYFVDVFDPNDPGDVTPFTIETFTLSAASIPEPSTLLLMGTGALSLLAALRRRTSLS